MLNFEIILLHEDSASSQKKNMFATQHSTIQRENEVERVVSTSALNSNKQLCDKEESSKTQPF